MKKAVDALATVALVLVATWSPMVGAQVAAPAKTKEPEKALDLRPPDITKSAKLKAIALSQSQHLPEKIEVIGTPELLPQTDSELPRPWMGPASVIWGMLHPLSAWRIVAPVSPEVGLAANGRPNLDYEVFRMSMK